MEHNKRPTCMFLFMMCVSTKEQVSMVIGTPFYVSVLMLDSNWHLTFYTPGPWNLLPLSGQLGH